MWRFCLLLLAVFVWTAFVGCQGQLEPKPLTPEQQRELQKRMQQVEDEERAHFGKGVSEKVSGTIENF